MTSPTTTTAAAAMMTDNGNIHINDRPWFLTRISHRLASKVWDFEQQISMNYELKQRQKDVHLNDFLQQNEYNENDDYENTT